MYAYLGQAKTNIAPRFGFAYEFRPKTVIRGAVGQYYNLMASSYVGGGFSSLPFITSVNYTNTPTTPTITMNAPFAGTATVGSDPSVIAQHKTIAPYTEQYNLALEQQLPGSVSLRIGYVGQRTLHQNNHGGPGNTEPDINYGSARTLHRAVAPPVSDLLHDHGGLRSALPHDGKLLASGPAQGLQPWLPDQCRIPMDSGIGRREPPEPDGDRRLLRQHFEHYTADARGELSV